MNEYVANTNISMSTFQMFKKEFKHEVRKECEEGTVGLCDLCFLGV